MPDLAAALDILVPAALYTGSLTANTPDAYAQIIWSDPRNKPAYADVLVADAQATKNSLKAYASDLTDTRSSGGFTYHGNLFSTLLDKRNEYTAAFALAQANPRYTRIWKLDDGTFVSMVAVDIIALATAVAAFIDGLFAAENTCATGIDNGTVTDTGTIAGIINSVPNSL